MLVPVGAIQLTLYAFLAPYTNKNFHFFCTSAATHLAYTQIIDLMNKGERTFNISLINDTCKISCDNWIEVAKRLQTTVPMEVDWLEAN